MNFDMIFLHCFPPVFLCDRNFLPFSTKNFILLSLKMLRRPKPGEDEDDLLAQQENFLKTVDLNNIGVTVVKKYDEKNTKKIEDENKNVLSDIIEKNLKTENFTFQFSTVSDSCATGFPSVSGRSTGEKRQKAKGRSIFMQNFNRKVDDSEQTLDDSKKRKGPENIQNANFDIRKDADSDSDLIKLKCQIHQENVQKLKGMSEQEIIEEQAKLIKTLGTNDFKRGFKFFR